MLIGGLLIGFFAVELILFVRDKPLGCVEYRIGNDSRIFLESFELDEAGYMRHRDSIHVILERIRGMKELQDYERVLTSRRDIFEKYLIISYLADPLNVWWSVPSRYNLQELGQDINRSIDDEASQIFRSQLDAAFHGEPDQDLLNDVRRYADHPINADGFRSIEFRPHITQRTKVLLLGDSFTYGFSAMPLQRSFADQLLADGYVVYNTGFPGTDPVHYLNALRHFLDRMDPDAVVLGFYAANDVLRFVLPEGAGHHPFHETGAGWISSVVDGEYHAEPVSAMNALEDCLCGEVQDDVWSWSRSLSLLKYRILSPSMVDCIEGPEGQGSPDQNITNDVLTEIQTICERAGVDFGVFLITEDAESIESTYQRNASALDSINMIPLIQVTSEQYRTSIGDPHWNNEGHESAYQAINAWLHDIQ